MVTVSDIKRLRLEYDFINILLSSFAFNFNVRRSMGDKNRTEFSTIDGVRYFHTGDIGAFTAKVVPVRVEPMTSKLKAPGTKRLNRKYDIWVSSFAFESTCGATPRGSC
jgi:hypothetical protein